MRPMIGRTRKSIYPMFAVKPFLGTHASSVLVWSGKHAGCVRTNMKIALKYGIAVTLVIAVWVALKHFVLHLQGPSAQFADVAVFNFSAIVGLMLGIKERRLAKGNRLTFGE